MIWINNLWRRHSYRPIFTFHGVVQEKVWQYSNYSPAECLPRAVVSGSRCCCYAPVLHFLCVLWSVQSWFKTGKAWSVDLVTEYYDNTLLANRQVFFFIVTINKWRFLNVYRTRQLYASTVKRHNVCKRYVDILFYHFYVIISFPGVKEFRIETKSMSHK